MGAELERATRDAELARDLRGVTVLHLAPDQDGALRSGNLAERALHEKPHLASLHGRLDVGGAIDERGGIQGLDRTTPPGTEPHERGVQDDAMEPGGEPCT